MMVFLNTSSHISIKDTIFLPCSRGNDIKKTGNLEYKLRLPIFFVVTVLLICVIVKISFDVDKRRSFVPTT